LLRAPAHGSGQVGLCQNSLQCPPKLIGIAGRDDDAIHSMFDVSGRTPRVAENDGLSHRHRVQVGLLTPGVQKVSLHGNDHHASAGHESPELGVVA